MTPSEKIDAEIQITSSLSDFKSLVGFEMEAFRKVYEIDHLREFVYYLSRYIDTPQPQIRRIVDKVYEEKIQKGINVNTEGSDTEVFLSVAKEVLGVYFWKERDIDSWCKKRFRIAKIL